MRGEGDQRVVREGKADDKGGGYDQEGENEDHEDTMDRPTDEAREPRHDEATDLRN
jgi:hypothetical protein